MLCARPTSISPWPRNPRVPQQTAEVTVFANGTVIRAQERSENLYASIDLAAGKLARQLRRWKERHSDHHHSHGHSASHTPSTDVVNDASPVEASLLQGREAELPDRGVRRKYFAMPPMGLEEARRQLDLIDHDFLPVPGEGERSAAGDLQTQPRWVWGDSGS